MFQEAIFVFLNHVPQNDQNYYIQGYSLSKQQKPSRIAPGIPSKLHNGMASTAPCQIITISHNTLDFSTFSNLIPMDIPHDYSSILSALDPTVRKILILNKNFL